MIKIHVFDQTQKQAYKLIHELLQTRKGCEYDGITAMRFMSQTYGLVVEWHVYSEIMDDMARNGEATMTQASGYCKYLIN